MKRCHETRLKLRWWMAAAGVLVVGSIGFSSNAAAEKIGKVQQGLVGGKEVDEKTQEIYGLLTFSMGGGSCSASLLRNDWAISAAHCVDAKDANGKTMPDPNRPGQNVMRPISRMRMKAAWGGGQTRKVTRVETFWPYDISLIKLDTPFTVNGKTTGYARDVFYDQFPYFGTPTTVTIKVFGTGINQFATGTGNNAIPSSSDDKFRMGTARVSREEGTLYWYPSEGGQMIAGGDSGGPSFATVGTSMTTVLVGVHALTHSEYVPGKPTDGWDWVTRTPEAADAPIRPVWKKIQEIMGPLPKAPDPDNPTPVFTYTVPFDTSVKPDAFHIIYGIKQDGTLMWHRHVINSGSRRPHSWNPTKHVGDGWLAGYAGAYPAGQNAIYTLGDNGELKWHWHTGILDGSYRWREPSHVVGTGWNSFTKIVPMDKGVVYGILPDGTLRWHKHLNYMTGLGGTGDKAWAPAKIVHSGFDKYRHVFGGGNGILYAVGNDNVLYWFKHKNYLERPSIAPINLPKGLPPRLVATLTAQWNNSWEGPKRVGDGWDHTQLTSSGDGNIYGVLPNGDLMYYKHTGWQNGTYVWDERLSGKIASGWNAYARVFARNDTSDAGSRNPEVDIVVN